MLEFLRKKKEPKQDKIVKNKSDGITVNIKLNLYTIKSSQDERFLGTVLLSDCQYSMLTQLLGDMVTFIKNRE